MTTDLKKQFFDTFGIEPIGCNDNKNCTGTLDCTQCPNAKYPQITDRILLELICIFANNPICFGGLNFRDVNTLKTVLLNSFIFTMNNDIQDTRKDILKHQVQELFKEER